MDGDPSMAYLLGRLTASILMSWLSVAMAKNRNRSPVLWGLTGLIFGIFPPLILAAIGHAHPKEERQKQSPTQRKINCSACGSSQIETQLPDFRGISKRCLNCGHSW